MRQLAVLSTSLHCDGWLRLRKKLSVVRPPDSFPAELGLTEGLVCPKPTVCVTGLPMDGNRVWRTNKLRMSQKRSQPGTRDSTKLTPGESGCSPPKQKRQEVRANGCSYSRDEAKSPPARGFQEIQRGRWVNRGRMPQNGKFAYAGHCICPSLPD